MASWAGLLAVLVVAAVRARCLRSRATVSADLRLLRVVGRTTRWAVGECVARKVSMRRSQMPRPTPLHSRESLVLGCGVVVCCWGAMGGTCSRQ